MIKCKQSIPFWSAILHRLWSNYFIKVKYSYISLPHWGLNDSEAIACLNKIVFFYVNLSTTYILKQMSGGVK